MCIFDVSHSNNELSHAGPKRKIEKSRGQCGGFN